MRRTFTIVALAGLGACTSSSAYPAWQTSKPMVSGALIPAATAADAAVTGDAQAPKDTTLPIGIGMTFGPSAAMLGAALDFNIDKMITFGPSVQYAIDDNVTLMAATGQLKYYLPIGDDDKPTLLPYATIGVGFANIDKDGRSSDGGLLINLGVGLRLRTGDHYRVGSEIRFNFLPDELAGEDAYVSLELVQVVIAF